MGKKSNTSYTEGFLQMINPFGDKKPQEKPKKKKKRKPTLAEKMGIGDRYN